MDVSKLPDVFVTVSPDGHNATLLKRKAETSSWTMYHRRDNNWVVSFFLTTAELNSYLRDRTESSIFVPYASDKATQVLGQSLGLPNRQEELKNCPEFIAVCKSAFGGLMACSPELYAILLKHVAEQINVEVDNDFKQAVKYVLTTMEIGLD